MVLVSSQGGRVIQSLTLLFSKLPFYLLNLAWEVLRLSVSSIKANRSVLHGIDFCLPGLGEHHVFQDLIWILAIGWLPCPSCLLCGFGSSSCSTFFPLSPSFWRPSVSGFDWNDFILGGSRCCHKAWRAPGSL